MRRESDAVWASHFKIYRSGVRRGELAGAKMPGTKAATS